MCEKGTFYGGTQREVTFKKAHGYRNRLPKKQITQNVKKEHFTGEKEHFTGEKEHFGGEAKSAKPHRKRLF